MKLVRLMWPALALIVLLSASSSTEAHSGDVHIRCGTQQAPYTLYVYRLPGETVSLSFDWHGPGVITFRVNNTFQRWETHTVGNRRGPTTLTVHGVRLDPYMGFHLAAFAVAAPCPAPDLVVRNFVLTVTP